MHIYSFYQDTKLYRIKIQNEFGSDTELVDLVVLGPPGKPLGPLEVKDVRAESCKLVWKPPEDDGGCPIIDYDIEMLCPKTKKWKKVCYVLYTRNIIQYTHFSVSIFRIFIDTSMYFSLDWKDSWRYNVSKLQGY